ncbi:MAG: deoxyuridine 5'-triphosphate nucleotidohydrolase [Desulfobacteraceae bacterium IS3]|nr:MAG: deoxyuridine 5'-triphosphate nucleotidohydrolase [Desulfobacteraceae bacterium IS3]
MPHTPVIQFLYVRPETDADIPLPCYMTPRASGMDIYAAVEKDTLIEPGAVSLIPTGFALSIPEGFEVQIRPRSGLAVNHQITVINAPATIDSDYRGEVKVALINLGKTPFTVQRKNRIAQMVVQMVYQAELKIVKALDKTERNIGGFGHTGM